MAQTDHGNRPQLFGNLFCGPRSRNVHGTSTENVYETAGRGTTGSTSTVRQALFTALWLLRAPEPQTPGRKEIVK
jgi:hypothetical protein